MSDNPIHPTAQETETPVKPDVNYSVAETEADRQAYFAIREAAYDEDLSFPRGAGAESAADADSLIILARDGGMILGGARLQLAENREDLHLVKLLPDYRKRLLASIQLGDDCAEYGALALIPSHRNTAITLGLYLYSEMVCRARLIRHVLFATERVRSRLYHRAYKAAYGKVLLPPTEYDEVCDFEPADEGWRAMGKLTLSVITFHYWGAAA